MVKDLPLPLRGVAHGAAGAVGYRVGDKFGNVVFNHTQGLARSTAGVMSRIAGIADKLAKGAKRSGPVAFTAFANLPFSDEPRAKSHKAQVKQQISEIARAAASPEAYNRKMHEVLAPVWESHPEVADEIEAKLVKLPTFLDRVAPKDPGTLFRLGLSLWEPTDVEVAKWEEYIKGAVFPMEVLDDVLSGQVSAQAALAMREMNPEIFRKFQEELLTRVEDIQENASYDQVVGLSVLYDVSLDSTMSKKYRRFMQDLWAKELEQNAAAESGQSQSRSSPEPMTKAQQLLE
jgi:hypothetical protein